LVPLTLLDMLDQLEAGIVNLRSRLTQVGTKPGPAKKRNSAAKKKKAAPKKKVASPKQLSLDPEPEGPPRPATGKRLALGRSIIQLRRNK
jgi:hypothetical protein